MSDHITEAEVYLRLIESFKTASGCARQLAHMRKESRFLSISRTLESLTDVATQVATRRSRT